MEIETILEQVQKGLLTVEEAKTQLKMEPFEDLGFAKPDHHRRVRQGASEVIYGAGKTPSQISAIADALSAHSEKPILVTRITEETAEIIQKTTPMTYYETAHIGLFGTMPQPDNRRSVLIITAGTSDIPVAEEAALTAEAMGCAVTRLFDVGVAGIHRLMAHMEEIMTAGVIVAVAGMEGALPSVIGGLADCPIIAVPTSVGYGASFGGVAALLSMLNTCASGISVVNIDNGFGAGYLASMIAHI